MPPRKRLGQLLTELHVVDEHQLQSALGHQKQWGGKLGAIIVKTPKVNAPTAVVHSRTRGSPVRTALHSVAGSISSGEAGALRIVGLRKMGSLT